MNSEFSAKGAIHISLGQRPRTSKQTGSGLKARTILGAVAIVRAFSPDFLYHILGRCPRLVWCRAFGPHEPEGTTE